MADDRTYRVCIAVSRDELDKVHQAAVSEGRTYGAWARRILLERAQRATERTDGRTAGG